MKKFFMVVFVLFFVAGCSTNTVEDNAKLKENITLENISKEIISSIEFPEMVKATSKNIKFKYDLVTEDFEHFSVFYAGSGGYADEILIFKLSSGKEVKELKDIFEKRIESRSTVFQGYAPAEYEKLEKAKIVTKGNYIMLIVCSNSNKAAKIFENSFE